MLNEIEKVELLRKIGNFFGHYFEEEGKYCIDNEDQIYRYSSADEGLIDWIDTLLESEDEGWDDDIYQICEACNYKIPNIRIGETKSKPASMVTIDYPIGNHKTRQISAGTYNSVTEAYKRKVEVLALRDTYLEKGKSYHDFQETIQKQKKEETLEKQRMQELENAKEIICRKCISKDCISCHVKAM